MVAQGGGELAGAGLVEVDDRVGVAELADGREVAALGDATAVERGELAGERPRGLRLSRVEGGLEIPVRRRAKRHPLALAVDDEPVATDWTRPADSPLMTFFQRTGDTS